MFLKFISTIDDEPPVDGEEVDSPGLYSPQETFILECSTAVYKKVRVKRPTSESLRCGLLGWYVRNGLSITVDKDFELAHAVGNVMILDDIEECDSLFIKARMKDGTDYCVVCTDGVLFVENNMGDTIERVKCFVRHPKEK